MNLNAPKMNGIQDLLDVSLFLRVPDTALTRKEYIIANRKWPVKAWNKQESGNAVAELKTLTEMYRLVTEVTHDALWEWDFRIKEMFWMDGGHFRLFGYPIENTIVPQAFWESLVHPEDLVRILEGVTQLDLKGNADTIWSDNYRFLKTNGEYAFVHGRGYIFYDKAGLPVRMIGATQDITRKIMLEASLANEIKSRQKAITNAAITAQENERATIGRELHDNLNQVLAVVKMYLQIEKTNKAGKDIYLGDSIELISNVIKQIRAISKNLVIPGLHIIGLFENIRNLVQDLMSVHTFIIEFEVYALSENEMNEKLQMNLFRIVQEQMNNILKHADATNVSIQLSRESNGINLVITDDGIGCDLSHLPLGIGIINIRSRAEQYDGTVSILSEPGKGYQLKVILRENI